jgi:hypothetical protein
MNKETHLFLNDLLAFTRYIWYSDKTDAQKLNALVSTLGHDLNGLIEDEPFFSPRVSGYSKLESVLD